MEMYLISKFKLCLRFSFLYYKKVIVKNILNESNYIVDNSKENYINCISGLANNIDLRIKISKNNKLLASSFKWSNVAKNIEKYIVKDL